MSRIRTDVVGNIRGSVKSSILILQPANAFSLYSATIAHEDQGVVEIRNPSPDGGVETSKTFTFDAVFSEKSTQRHIYDVCAAPVVQSVLEGYNGTVFAYGQTGAGKVNEVIHLGGPLDEIVL